MTNHVVRLYAFAGALLVLFLTWAAIAAQSVGAAGRRQGRPPLGGAGRPRAEAPPRVPRRTARGGTALARLPRPPGCPSPGDLRGRPPSQRSSRPRARPRASPRRTRRPPRGTRPPPRCARRDPATRDDHEDLVIQRRSFRAMGTEVALLPRRRARARGRGGPRIRRARVRAGRGAALALSSRIRALGAQPRRQPRGRRRPARRGRPRARRADEDRRTVRPDRPRRARRSRLRPDVRGGRARRRLRSDAVGRCGGARPRSLARTIELEPGTHLDLGGIGKGYTVDRAAAILSAAGPALVDAGGDIAARGRPDALGWRVGIETPGDTLTLALEDARSPPPAATGAAGAATARSATI